MNEETPQRARNMDMQADRGSGHESKHFAAWLYQSPIDNIDTIAFTNCPLNQLSYNGQKRHPCLYICFFVFIMRISHRNHLAKDKRDIPFSSGNSLVKFSVYHLFMKSIKTDVCSSFLVVIQSPFPPFFINIHLFEPSAFRKIGAVLSLQRNYRQPVFFIFLGSSTFIFFLRQYSK